MGLKWVTSETYETKKGNHDDFIYKMYKLLPCQMVQNIAEKICVMFLVKKNQKHAHNQQQKQENAWRNLLTVNNENF